MIIENAIVNADVDAMMHLLNQNAGIDYGTAMATALEHNRKDIAKLLCDDMVCKGMNENVLKQVVCMVDDDIMTYLVEDCGIDIERFILIRTAKNTNLYRGEDLEHVKLLARLGSDVDANEEENLTPLHFAVRSEGQIALDIVKYLIERGADVNAKNLWSETPLHLAARSQGQIALDIVRYLNECGADLNAGSLFLNRTPLHYAIESQGLNALDMVKCLLECGADLNANDDSRETPLHFAVQSQGGEIVKYLIENGADVNAKDERKRTPLYWAIQYNMSKIEMVLRENGAVLNVPER